MVQVFYNPARFANEDGTEITFGSTQTETFTISFNTAISFASIAAVFAGKKLKVYSASEYTIAGTNLSVDLSIDGKDFRNYVGKTIEIHMSFYTANRTEYILPLKIVETYV